MIMPVESEIMKSIVFKYCLICYHKNKKKQTQINDYHYCKKFKPKFESRLKSENANEQFPRQRLSTVHNPRAEFQSNTQS